MKKHVGSRGFTLIEMIISIALLGIITMAFLALFANSIMYIQRSGEIAKNSYSAQNQVEQIVADSTKAGGTSTSTPVILQLNFPGRQFLVDVRRISVNYGSSHNMVVFTTN